MFRLRKVPPEQETRYIADELAEIVFELSKVRIYKGISQEQLAKECGIRKSVLVRIENLDVIPQLDELIQIAKHLGLRVALTSIK